MKNVGFKGVDLPLLSDIVCSLTNSLVDFSGKAGSQCIVDARLGIFGAIFSLLRVSYPSIALPCDPKVAHPHQVVGGQREQEDPTHFWSASVPGLA